MLQWKAKHGLSDKGFDGDGVLVVVTACWWRPSRGAAGGGGREPRPIVFFDIFWKASPSAKYSTWQTAHHHPTALSTAAVSPLCFVECSTNDTRQRTLCQVSGCRVEFAEWGSLSATLGKHFAECIPAFAECFWHSAYAEFPVVRESDSW